MKKTEMKKKKTQHNTYHQISIALSVYIDYLYPFCSMSLFPEIQNNMDFHLSKTHSAFSTTWAPWFFSSFVLGDDYMLISMVQVLLFPWEMHLLQWGLKASPSSFLNNRCSDACGIDMIVIIQ